ncbi:MAG: DUF177 domain-containing protein [Prolixibacteraceae bacterium]|nr:DUF177 domain-containing protein [Prolixibacteraceae bacterium]
MNYRSKYTIAYKGLKDGDHYFDFEIDKLFFKMFEGSEVNDGLLHANVKLTKQENLLKFEVSVKGTVDLMCDRCLDFFRQKVKSKAFFYVKFGENLEEINDEIVILPFEEHQINIAQYVYEQIILGIPIKRVHPEGKNGKCLCNPEMVASLNKYLTHEENISGEEQVDERWNELKKLLDNQ